MKSVIKGIFTTAFLALVLILSSELIDSRPREVITAEPISAGLLLGGSALASLGSQLLGSIGQKKRRRRQQKQRQQEQELLRQQQQEQLGLAKAETASSFDAFDESAQGTKNSLESLQSLNDQLATEANQSYYDSTEGSAALGQIRDFGQKQRNQLRNTANLNDLSDEALIAGLGNINESQGSAIADLAGAADANRRNTRAMQMSGLGQLTRGNLSLGGQQLSKAGLQSNMVNSAFGNAATGSQIGANNVNQQFATNMGFSNANASNLNNILQMLAMGGGFEGLFGKG